MTARRETGKEHPAEARHEALRISRMDAAAFVVYVLTLRKFGLHDHLRIERRTFPTYIPARGLEA